MSHSLLTLYSSHFTLYFLRSFLSSFYPLFVWSFPHSLSSRLRVVRWCPLSRHNPTVNEWVCHTANNLHSSCLICLGLNGSSRGTRAERMCLGLWRAGSRSTAQGNSTQAQGLFGELVLDFSIRLWRRGTRGLAYPWSRITFFPSRSLFYLSKDGLLTMHALFQQCQASDSYSYTAHIIHQEG